MIRRSFRIGLTLGLLAGLAYAVLRMVQSQREAAGSGPPRPWPPLDAPRPGPVAESPRAAPPAMPEHHHHVVPPPLPATPTTPPARATPAVAPVAPLAPAGKAAKRATRKAAGKKKAARKKAAAVRAERAWVEPEQGVCPTTHPVKAKLTSRIFHLPGMFNYERTRPDRCYLDAEAAAADGLRPAKR